jgi:superfamily II DNA or RNA helicase
VEALFERVRGEATRPIWSRGVELARAEAVVAEPAEDGELLVRVRTPSVVHPSVILYTEDAEWECDCGGVEDPCEHVAAAVIALRQARREGRPLPESTVARVGYRLAREASGLALERVVVEGERATPLRTTLTALASGRVAGPRVVASQADLAAERALGPRLRGLLPRGVMRSLLRPLAECSDVTLDGRPIRPCPEPCALRARLVDAPDGFRLFVEHDPPIDERLPDGFVRCGDTLRELAPTRLTGRELEAYARDGRRFAADEVTELLAEVLPALEPRIEVCVEAARLPTSCAEPPRLVLETSEDGDGLSVLPTLVYGDPPVARVDAGRLTHLRGPVPLRDQQAERRLSERLRRALGLVPGHRVRLEASDAIRLVARLPRFDAEVVGSAHRRFFQAPALVPSLSAAGGGIDVRFESPGAREGAPAHAEPAAVLAAWQRGEALVPLLEGGFAPLPQAWLARHGERVADLLAARGADGRLPACVLPDLARLCDELGAPRPPEAAALEQRLAARPAALRDLPAPLAGALRPYQETGARWLAWLGEAELGALLADDMGLGKTLQALAALRPPALVVAPTSVLPNWSAEIARFRPDLRVAVHHGARRALDADADVTLTSYALLRLDLAELAAHGFETLVLDEAQAIKNPDSQVARAAFALGGRRRIALTGTPVENRLEELWSQLHFLNPGLLGGRADFQARYATPIETGDEGVAARLRERIRPFVLRRTKAEVAPELPPRTDVVLRVELSEAERAVYDAVRAATVEQVVARLEAGGGVLDALEALLRLRQACCDPSLVPGQPASEAPSAKLGVLVERLETTREDGHKALVFSQWTALLDRVEPHLAAAGLAYVRLDGSTRDREAVVRRFQDPEGPPVFLVSLRAGGTGLNLTAADHVFLLDPWWNPAVEDQAADRAHRIGQDRPVFVHRMVARDTVEERILLLQDRKREIAAAALGEAGRASRLTRDELLALLRA